MHSVIRSADGQYIIKKCLEPSLRRDAFLAYRREFLAMKSLFLRDPERYRLLFPVYRTCGFDRLGNPCIKMDHISGITLEQKLRSMAHRSPHRYLTDSQILYLFEQLSAAQEMLSTVGLLQLDLNPENIIVVSDRYDIRLIDLTDACSLSDRSLPYNLIDYHASVDLPPSMQLREAGALLFTRLFYSGNDRYQEAYSQSSFLKRYHHYWSLLKCLDAPESRQGPEDPGDCLRYWNLWLRQLRLLLS
ncbi:MAG TPA: hypothetical protein DCF49_00730 [Lachnospiraceae bacterium]|jgi:serine/threonine protein kinase|nr:hypothetical protein [Lachnospiraceae bacterium]